MEKKWKKGWKVIRSTKYTRRSCWVAFSSVDYPVNEVTERPEECGPLCVFSTREAAETFIRMNWMKPLLSRDEIKVVKCLYQPSKDNYLWDSTSLQIETPEGTVLADKVKCLE